MNWALHSSAALTVPPCPDMCPCFSTDLHLFQNDITQNLNDIKIHGLRGTNQKKGKKWSSGDNLDLLHHSEQKQQEERLCQAPYISRKSTLKCIYKCNVKYDIK
jgi:hypothetical protein